MVSVMCFVPLKVLVWNSQKSLLNDLVYLKSWEPQNMKTMEIIIFFVKVSIKQPSLPPFQILEALKDQVLW